MIEKKDLVLNKWIGIRYSKNNSVLSISDGRIFLLKLLHKRIVQLEVSFPLRNKFSTRDLRFSSLEVLESFFAQNSYIKVNIDSLLKNKKVNENNI